MTTKTAFLVVAAFAVVLAAWSPVAAQSPPPAPPTTPVITVNNLSTVQVLIFQILNGRLNLLSTVPANAGQFVIRNFQAVDGQVDMLMQSTALGVTSQVGRVLTVSNVTNIVIRTNSAGTGLVATITGLLNGPVSVVLNLVFTTVVGALLSILSDGPLEEEERPLGERTAIGRLLLQLPKCQIRRFRFGGEDGDRSSPPSAAEMPNPPLPLWSTTSVTTPQPSSTDPQPIAICTDANLSSETFRPLTAK
ncbi:hypothetical protein AXG93_4587s1010 [Marchantia polymorpha subsp. ruderalis]|uniref:PPC domain-containing protein n=1 Tax=Marchantia polymorpha subsp. ruderalis TaxID=1480154 RepID=A0A176WM96_MARPO|nr:hypothetical protein AXG93_4587s1010 [Marchantia polymorpha subsp. ruderalis]